MDPTLEDGTEVAPGTELSRACGPAATLLAGERVALNFLQHLSGIATYARRLKEELAGTPAEFLDTRKTTPGLRSLQKYAVRVGGGQNHRLRLDDGILIKNNHLQLWAEFAPRWTNAKRQRPAGYHIEVEITSLAELEEALKCGADGVLLDNMTPEKSGSASSAPRGTSAWKSRAASTPEYPRLRGDGRRLYFRGSADSLRSRRGYQLSHRAGVSSPASGKGYLSC